MRDRSTMVTGAVTYSVLKYESGVHRVQQCAGDGIPGTYSDINLQCCSYGAEDVEVHIDDKDIRIDVMRASMVDSVSIRRTLLCV